MSLTGKFNPPPKFAFLSMGGNERQLRGQLLAEAKTWIGTPYHLSAMIKGVGCDCATFLLAVLRACGLALNEKSDQHVADWFAHTGAETYMLHMVRHAYKVAETISVPTLQLVPGDIALTRSANSKLYNHGGFVIDWPMVIHSVEPCVCIVNASTDDLWSHRKITVFDPYKKGLA